LFPGGEEPETDGTVGLKMDKGIAFVREHEILLRCAVWYVTVDVSITEHRRADQRTGRPHLQCRKGLGAKISSEICEHDSRRATRESGQLTPNVAKGTKGQTRND
jgi:hypothetical protein